MLEHAINVILPPIISLCELIGIFVVTVTALQSFYKYLKGLVTRTPSDFKFELAQGLASGLEFKMAAEILKTVQVRDKEELLILGAVILLRALLSLLIHFEMKEEHNHPLSTYARPGRDKDNTPD
jgi:uncharacterized membrane protein